MKWVIYYLNFDKLIDKLGKILTTNEKTLNNINSE